MDKNQSEAVVLVHGILLGSAQMFALSRYLRKRGYQVLAMDYASRHVSIEAAAAQVAAGIDTQIAPQSSVHFVGFSLGGLVIRALLQQYRPQHLGRVVQIGAPNHGSEMADYFSRFSLYQSMMGPAGMQLTTQPDPSTALGGIDYELGVIAGSLSLDPFSYWLLPSPNDGAVSVRSTCVDGMQDHVILPVAHFWLPLSVCVHQQTHCFLREGSFVHRGMQVVQPPALRDVN